MWGYMTNPGLDYAIILWQPHVIRERKVACKLRIFTPSAMSGTRDLQESGGVVFREGVFDGQWGTRGWVYHAV